MGLIKLALLGVGVLFIGVVLGLVVLPSFVSDILFRNVQYSPAEEFVAPEQCEVVLDDYCVVERAGRNYIEPCEKLVCDEGIVPGTDENNGNRCRQQNGYVQCLDSNTGQRCVNGFWHFFVCPEISGGSNSLQMECFGGSGGGCGI